jgi:hypothetical protein
VDSQQHKFTLPWKYANRSEEANFNEEIDMNKNSSSAVKILVVCDVTPYGCYQRFGGTYRLHLQEDVTSPTTRRHSP